METNIKRLNLLLHFLNLTLGLIFLSLIFVAYSGIQHVWEIGNTMSVQRNSYVQMPFWNAVSFYFILFKSLCIRVFYTVLLLTIRQIVKDVLHGELFSELHIRKISRLATFLLWFAGVLAVLLLPLFTYSAITAVKPHVLATIVGTILSIFENYILTALIILGIAEVFVVGLKLKEEHSLTI